MSINENTAYRKQRMAVLDEIAGKYNISSSVIEAMKCVPREYFVANHLQRVAYEDEPQPIAAGQTISQIATVAMQTDLLDVHKGQRVLEVGTGSGYQATVLYEMGATVFSIERFKELHLIAMQNREKIGHSDNMHFIHGDGFNGLEEFAPFDRILVTCGAPEIPEKLKKQLRIGGKMVIPVGEKTQEMMVIVKQDQEKYHITSAGFFVFVPMLPGTVE